MANNHGGAACAAPHVNTSMLVGLLRAQRHVSSKPRGGLISIVCFLLLRPTNSERDWDRVAVFHLLLKSISITW